MAFFKNISNGFIDSVSTGTGQIEIVEKEYNDILNMAKTFPQDAPSGYTYKLRADDLEWELAELPPEPEPSEDPAEIEDYEKALDEMGVQLNGD